MNQNKIHCLSVKRLENPSLIRNGKRNVPFRGTIKYFIKENCDPYLKLRNECGP